MSSSESLPDELKDLFRDAFPDVDLDRVRVHDELPWIARFAPIPVSAIALGRNIHLDGGCDYTSVDDMATIGHELVHVSQWCRADHPLARALGAIRFAASYVGQYAVNRLRGMEKVDAYREIRFEREARRFERVIGEVLGRQIDSHDPGCEPRSRVRYHDKASDVRTSRGEDSAGAPRAARHTT